MKLRHSLSALALTLALAATTSLAHGQVMADRVPADAIAYAGWVGSANSGYQGSHFQGMLDALQLPKFLSDRFHEAQEKRGGDRPELAPFVAMLKSVAKSPTALYLTPFDFATNPDHPTPRGAIVSQVGAADAQKIADALTPLLAKEKENKPDAPAMGVKAVGDYVVLYVGDDAAPARFGGAAPADSLASQEAFKSAIAQLNTDSTKSAVVLYADGEALYRQLEQAVLSRRGNGPDGQMFPTIMEGLGVTGVKQIALQGTFDGPNFRSSAFMGMKDRRVGLLGLFDSKPLSDDAFALIPANATSAGVFRFDGERFLADMQEMAASISDRGAQQFERGMQQLYYFTGVDVKKDLLPAFGDEFVYFTAPDAAGLSVDGLTLINALRDEVKATTAMTAMETFFNSMTAQRNPNTKAQFKPEQLPAPFDKITAHVMHTDKFAYCWAIADGKFFMSTTVQGLQAALESTGVNGGPKKPGLLTNPTFTALKKSLGDHAPATFRYNDLTATGPEAYEIFRRVLAAAKEFRPDDKMYELPPLSALKPHFGPVLQVAWSDAAGFHMQQAGPFPLAEALTPQQFLFMRIMQEIAAGRRARGENGNAPGAGNLP